MGAEGHHQVQVQRLDEIEPATADGESLREAKLVKPGEIVKCDFNPGLFVARRLMKGSRLRLVITSPNSIFWQKNYCSGGVVAEETAKDARTCHVQVYHDAEHASAVQLPLR